MAAPAWLSSIGRPGAAAGPPVFENRAAVVAVVKLVGPMVVATGALAWLGFYFVCGLYMAYFARYIGRYRWLIVGLIAVVFPTLIYLAFELGFRCGCRRADFTSSASFLIFITIKCALVIEILSGLAGGFADGCPTLQRDVAVIGVLSRTGHRRPARPGRHERRGHPAAGSVLIASTGPGGPTSAVIFLAGIYWGALFGGVITSILFNIPGEPWAVALLFDGFPLAKRLGNRVWR